MEAAQGFDRLWFWFRDHWGVVWALRTQERFNRTAELALAGTAHLVWPGGGRRNAEQVPRLDDPATAATTFRGLIGDSPSLANRSSHRVESHDILRWRRYRTKMNRCQFRKGADTGDHVDRLPQEAPRALVVLAVLAVIAALYLLKAILIPVAVALVVSCMLSPVARLSPPAFSLRTAGSHCPALAVGGGRPLSGELDGREPGHGDLHVAVGNLERLAGQVSGRITDLIRDQPYLRAFLPEPGTIDRLGDTNRALLIEKLSYGLTDFTTWVAQGFVILVLVIFMLIESEMLVSQADSLLYAQRDRCRGRQAGPLTDHPQDPLVLDCPDLDQRGPGDRGRTGAMGTQRPVCRVSWESWPV